MDAADDRCRAMTKAGDRCRNKALAGMEFCRIHAKSAESAEAERARVAAVAGELNKIADEVKKEAPEYTPPPFSAASLRKVLKENIHVLSSYMPSDMIKEMLRNLEGTKKEDLLDPETWKGLWYILNFTLQTQSKAALEHIGKRLAFVPGMDMMVQLGASVIESPKDLLDVETWKGAAMILNATVMANASSIKRRVMGGSDE